MREYVEGKGYYVRGKGEAQWVDGEIIAHVSSRVKEPRWVEFTLFRAKTDQFVVERIGKSVVFHNEDCFLVNKNHLSSVPYSEIPGDYVPCNKCRPSRFDIEGLYPERERPFFMTCETARGVIRFLEQVDDDDLRYLTNVARALLTEAAQKDDRIYDAFIRNRTLD